MLNPAIGNRSAIPPILKSILGGGKPGMTGQHDAFVQISLTGMAERLNLPEESLDDWI